MEIGSRIRAARKAAGLSQEELARRAGMTLNGMAYIERGHIQDPHISSLIRIARALEVPVEQLLTESPVPQAKPGGSQLPKAPVPSTPRSFAEEEERRYSGELTLDERAKALLREYPPERLEDLARIVGVFYLKSDYTLGVVKDELRRRAHDPEEVAQLLARLHEEARLLTEALNYLIEQRREGGI